ncbi:CaiB/BaiF CoA transferase family protein [Mycobacterium vicinigordonae]|uniref:CoA transferase n=1 Tax=Mycobacterium vicinigordonae TaxID=1719132 RepID=A0A7D6I4J3_9MYCO|nr:CoA transferase [Mycobacterium vicinigordonae]QLL09794.1 CoA transferase [Mycobacterium vicinigordonae]
MPDNSLPLTGVRVIDFTDGAAGFAGRFLADLGADVVLVEPPEGAASRREQPQHDGHGLRFATAHANKRGVVADVTIAEGRETLLCLTDSADIFLESHPAGHLAALGVGQEIMRSRNPRLVVASITDFGQTGPYRDYRASEAVFAALSSLLTRSGAPGREPLLPPGHLATQTAAVDVAYAALLACFKAQRGGLGDYLDCSLFDLVVQDLDPGFGMAGTATMGQPLYNAPLGRPDVRMMYPIVPCADGHVRMFIASAKQWRAMFSWIGEPEELSDPMFEHIFGRFMNWSKIQPVILDFFADKTRAEIVSRSSELGIAIGPLNTAHEILASDHVRERNSFAHAEIAPRLHAAIPNGYLEFGGQRAGFRHRAPELGEHTAELHGEPPRPEHRADGDGPARPLAGLRVLDLGVIVVGAETGRSLADQGAEVIKVENREFLDGARQTDGPGKVGYSFALGNRNKRSLGLNLRTAAGQELFARLVIEADIVLTNFKPGTLEALGLGYERLREINPRVVLVESSALGNTGPWSKRMGYGPLVRATVGLTTLWRHPDTPDGFGDDQTVYPDHAAARVGAAAVVAALIERERTGRGQRIGLAQMETVFSQLATEYVRESLQPGTLVAKGNSGEFDAPSGIYTCTGEDAYCAVTVDGDEDWANLAKTIARPDLAEKPEYATAAGRVAHRDDLDAVLQEWIAPLSPREAQQRLQAGKVAAGAAVHVKDLLTDPHLAARHQLGELRQPGHEQPLEALMGPALFERIPAPELRPAPALGSDTVELCGELLSLSEADIDELICAGVLEIVEAKSG